ncbi:hypothetical protein DFR50_13848 [Roseiarcus fermentans]|uniref:Uncharacterized protein n=1 Tax=Roseiarcus fermentans TaxID=1473586 RepID=A0A366EQT3_9HYPH|nr:hypothetical protein [Roseiarcus fermentans]RBP04664.1 hypothetical protein DFR50_13848 [Roseiarcus fermentans]
MALGSARHLTPVAALTAPAAVPAVAAWAQAPAGRPNIVFIIAGDLGNADLG